MAQHQRCHCEGVVVEVEEEAENQLLIPIEGEEEEDQLQILEEVEEEEGNLPLQEEVEVAAGTCHLTERLVVVVGGDMWVRSSWVEEGGQCPWRKGEVVAVEEKQPYWGLNWQ